MRKILPTLTLLFIATLGFSQAPCTVTNSINSGSVWVQLYAAPPGSCLANCPSATFCLYPGGTATIPQPPCGKDYFDWNYAVVTPTTDECSTPCTAPPGTTVVSPVGCLPALATAFHCHAGTTYTSFFAGPNTLFIF